MLRAIRINFHNASTPMIERAGALVSLWLEVVVALELSAHLRPLFFLLLLAILAAVFLGMPLRRRASYCLGRLTLPPRLVR